MAICLIFGVSQAKSTDHAEYAGGEDQFIIVEESNFDDEWPERFRSSDMPLDLSEEALTGLRELNMMGGGQPSQKQIKNIVKLSEKPVIVLDFRQEPHSYIAGIPITWYRPEISDIDLGSEHMKTLENDFSQFLMATPVVSVNSVIWTGGQDYDVTNTKLIGHESAQSNAEMMESNGAQYKRFYVSVVPTEQQVSKFESLIKQVSAQDVNLYFQCWDGTGRSTEFMVMYDILTNGDKVSLQTIADRQALMGGLNVLELPPQTSPNYARSLERKNFLVDYYAKHSTKN